MTAAVDRLTAEETVRVRSAHPLPDVLARAGIQPPHRWDGRADYKISCPRPEHRDSDPSCVIHPQTNRWHCFGCGAGGDVFALVRAVEGITSPIGIAAFLDQNRTLTVTETAVARPASGGVRPDPHRTPLPRILAINDAAWAYYTQPVLAHRARHYLCRRGIDVAALEQETGRPLAGCTPYQRSGLVDHLRARGVTADELIDAGWAARQRDGRLVDRYRHRLLIPVRNRHDRVIGVYGRDLTNRATSKYLNTAETVAFRKGSALYRPSTPRLDPYATLIVCEGSLDALAIAAAAATAGRSAYFAPVSPSGTALTDQHVQQLPPIHHAPPLVCADGDVPGRAASAVWVSKILASGRECVATVLPAEDDPASWLQRHGPGGLCAFVRKGCLQVTGDEVHPVHAGAFIAATLADDAAARGIRTRAAVADVIGALAQNARQLRGEGAQRYTATAAATLAGRGFGPEAALAQLLATALTDAHRDASRGLGSDAVADRPMIWLDR